MERNIKISENHIPPTAYPYISALLASHEVDVKIVKGRTTKFADFIPPHGLKKRPVITINNNLNRYSFLITFLHEYAHYLVWKDGKIYAKPHGRSWKNHFRLLMQDMMDKAVFPESLMPQLTEHFQNPSATSCTDTRLFKELSIFDTDKTGFYIDDIPDGSYFETINGRLFKREKKARKRILCTDQNNRKKYLFSPICRVFPIKGKQYMLVFS